MAPIVHHLLHLLSVFVNNIPAGSAVAFRPMRRLSLLLFALIGCSAATSAPTEAPAADAPECRVVDTSVEATITSYVEGGVRIHTFLAPELSASTATHVIEGDHALVVVDTQMLRDYARQFREYVDALGKPVTHVIISHGHPDHYFGLEFFEDLPTYALPQTQTDMKQRHKFHLKMHRETEHECDAVTDRVRFAANDLPLGEQVLAGIHVVIENAKDSEDNDQVVIRIPDAKTLILQDLMATDAHGFTAAGMIDGWIEVLRGYEAQPEYTHVLAGHGSPTDHAGIATMIAYLEESQRIFDTAQTREAFIEAMRASFPERQGMYIVDLMAMMQYEQDKK